MTTEQDWYGPDTATFGDRLTGAREAAGMNQTDLARRLGVRLETLRAWEEDVSEPRANRLSMISGLLNVSMRWLLTGQGDGVEAPDGLDTPEAMPLLHELRELRSDMLNRAEQLGRLEKKLRAALRG
ncbi:helix-turn-helix transcriptional regulator [Sulfitobacter sp. D35]|uniref:helix-turn-helix domain-containing protein n=1 Tax=Sulfitobacter sp. D35 TaxID=3083252 RepID=UPI00296E576E|nr:helix-turn-helix transcriptional regulator [Sulfitobacter sp. D35]MDW4499665.1 helix-turn-helix transcriptional regulator [Sulfitobacter sp. D35]